jgi:hypothetical protein
VPPHTALAKAHRVMPEFQLQSESSIAGYVNFLQWALRWGYKDVKPTYEPLLAIAHDVPAVVAWLNLRLSANQLAAGTCALIEQALASKAVQPDSDTNARLDLLASAAMLVMASPEYLVQK